MVDGAHEAGRGCRARASLSLRRPRLHPDRAPLRPPRRGAEPWAPRDRLRPSLRRRRGLLEGGDGACRAHLRRPLRAVASAAAWRSSSAAPRGGPTCSTSRSTRSIRTRGSRAAGSSRRRRRASRRPSDTKASCSRSSFARVRRAATSCRRRAPLARGARGRARDPACSRARRRRPRNVAPRARGERRPRESLAGGGGTRLRDPDGRVRALPRRRRRPGGPVEGERLEPGAVARAARGDPLDARPRRADRGARPSSSRCPRRRIADAARAPCGARRPDRPRDRAGGPGGRCPPPGPRDARRPRPRRARPCGGGADRQGSRRASRPEGSSSTSATRRGSKSSSRPSRRSSRSWPDCGDGRSWTRTRGLRLIRAAL